MLKIIKITKKKAHYLGLSLIGLLITVAIISALAALSVPNLLELRIKANEAWAISTLMKLASAFDTYRAMQNSYPSDFAALRTVNPPLIDEKLAADGMSEGYMFSVDEDAITSYSFIIYAQPQLPRKTGVRAFKILEDGRIYYVILAPGQLVTDPAVQWIPFGMEGATTTPPPTTPPIPPVSPATP